MHVAIIIPALNEGGNIRRLLGEIPDPLTLTSNDDSELATSIVTFVVDNGSSDNTATEAAAGGAVVVSESRKGYGYACAAGVKTARDADVCVFMDGDGSFDPAELSFLLEPIAANRADLVLGSRVAQIEPGAMPPHQRFGNWLASAIMRLLYGLKISDPGTYRAIRYDLLSSLDMREMTFGWPTEMIVKSARHGARVVEVPVHYRKRWSGQSKVSGTLRGTLLATYFILGVTLRYAFIPNKSSSDRSNR